MGVFFVDKFSICVILIIKLLKSTKSGGDITDTAVYFGDGTINFYLVIIVRLLLAALLGGIIGYQRESMNKPAGFRTHTLVCIGAALVMVTSEFIFKKYSGYTNADPARLGAQVISGIGFLGAGTIIREGFSVRGLTTAASLWVVSCVGIAAGIGFYEGAVSATLLIYLTLIVLKKMQDYLAKKSQYKTLFIEAADKPGQIGAIGHAFGRHDISIVNIEFISIEDDKNVLIKFLLKLPHGVSEVDIFNDLHSVEGVQKVYGE